jgi:ABC-type transporter Mla MlaB component
LKSGPEDLDLCQSCKRNYIGTCFCCFGCRCCCKEETAAAESGNNENNKSSNELAENTRDELIQSVGDGSIVVDSIILDLSSVRTIDEAAVKTLREMVNDYKKDNVNLYLTNCSRFVLNYLKIFKCYPDGDLSGLVYLTNIDAVTAIKTKKITTKNMI